MAVLFMLLVVGAKALLLESLAAVKPCMGIFGRYVNNSTFFKPSIPEPRAFHDTSALWLACHCHQSASLWHPCLCHQCLVASIHRHQRASPWLPCHCLQSTSPWFPCLCHQCLEASMPGYDWASVTQTRRMAVPRSRSMGCSTTKARLTGHVVEDWGHECTLVGSRRLGCMYSR